MLNGAISQKPKIAILTSMMDGRPGKGTSIILRKTVERLRVHRDEFDITLIHKEYTDDPLYKEFKEIIIPNLHLPKFSGFFSELWFFLTSKEHFDLFFFGHSRVYPTFWLAPARLKVINLMDGGPLTSGFQQRVKGKLPWHTRIFLPFFMDGFVGLSEYGKQSIINTYGARSEQVAVVYPGVESIFKPLSDKTTLRQTLNEKYGFPKETFILDVSRFDPHKNILGVIRAYHLLRTQYNRKEKLVFVGGRHIPAYNTEVDTLIVSLGLKKDIIIAPFIEEQDLPRVYNAAHMLVFPSFYEGFGMPAAEAMACGLPVVVSDIPALREVVGEAGVVVDPYQPKAIAQGMYDVLSNEHTYRHMQKAGIERAKIFTWENDVSALSAFFKLLLFNRQDTNR